MDYSGSEQGPVGGGRYKRDNEPWGSIKDGEFFDYLSDC
jgi:hypothetical protein